MLLNGKYHQNQSSRGFQIELKEARKEIYMDPLTGLYNKKALSKHLDLWLTQDPSQQVAAIVVCVDQLSEVNKKFGHLTLYVELQIVLVHLLVMDVQICLR